VARGIWRHCFTEASLSSYFPSSSDTLSPPFLLSGADICAMRSSAQERRSRRDRRDLFFFPFFLPFCSPLTSLSLVFCFFTVVDFDETRSRRTSWNACAAWRRELFFSLSPIFFPLRIHPFSCLGHPWSRKNGGILVSMPARYTPSSFCFNGARLHGCGSAIACSDSLGNANPLFLFFLRYFFPLIEWRHRGVASRRVSR